MSKHSQRRKEKRRLFQRAKQQDQANRKRYPWFYKQAANEQELALQKPMVRNLFSQLGFQIAQRLAQQWYDDHLKVEAMSIPRGQWIGFTLVFTLPAVPLSILEQRQHEQRSQRWTFTRGLKFSDSFEVACAAA